MKIDGFIEEKVKSYKVELKDLKDYIVLNFIIQSDHPYLCFFFLVDPDGIVRVQFEGRKDEEKIFLGEKEGSIGTYPGKINLGEWRLYYTNYGLVENENNQRIPFSIEIETIDKIDFNNYTLIGEERWVDYPSEKNALTINFDGNKKKSNEERWYRGDYHTHTKLSDCHMTPKEAAEYCEDQGIDFLFLTEHNLINTGFEKSKTLFIPAIEVTLLKGHLLVYGLREFINCFSYETFNSEYLNNVIEKAKNSNALLNIAHPMMVPWDWKFMEMSLKDIDMMEIVNCPNWHTSEDANRKAIELIDLLWDEGFKVTGVGGSDNHLKPNEKYEGYLGPSLYSDPATYIYSKGLSEREIFNAIKKGRVYVSRGIKLDIDILAKNHNYFPGDEITENNFMFKINIIENKRETLKLFLILNGNVIDEKKKSGNGEINFNISWANRKYNWARVGIKDNNDNFIAYINPVYRGIKSSNLLIWNDLLDLFYKKD